MKDSTARFSRRSVIGRFLVTATSLFSAPTYSKAMGNNAAKKWDEKFEVSVDFEIAAQDGFRARRPYVAVFVEDKAGKIVKTLNIFVQTSRRGPRWIPDLRRWYRDDQDRLRTPGAQDLISTVSSATRMPGKYNVIWNGKDDSNKLVDQGDYTIYVEAAREHGSYQLMKAVVNAGVKPATVIVEGNLEIKGATVEYRKRK